MAETRVLAPLLRLADEAGGKAILVGHPGQLPAVGAGGLFAALCDELGAIDLTQNRRQLDAQERAVLARLRSGDPETYVALASARGRLHVDDDATAAKHGLLQDWWQAAAADPARSIMLAYRRHDVSHLNDAARALTLESGRLGQEALMPGDLDNDTRLSVRNGMRGTVVELDPANRALTLETDSCARRCLPASYAAEHLEHGYALTGHAAQGATVDRAFVLLRDEGALREWGYVACSRARRETRLYLVGAVGEPEHHRRRVDARDPTARLAGALERPAAERTALAQRRSDTSDVTRRALERCRRQREQALETAERRLSVAEEKLRDLGWLGRRRQRVELHAEISRQRTAVSLARTALDELPLEQREQRPRPTLWTRRETRPPFSRYREHIRDLGLER